MAKSLFRVASLLLLLPLSLAAIDPKTVVKETVARKEPKLGSYQVIENVNDSYIQHLGNYAVAQYNKNTNSTLRFQKVICGKYQIVGGTNYDLLLIAYDGHVSWVYEALIYVDLEEKRTLNDFFKIKLKN